MAKAHKLPSTMPLTKYSKPLELLYLDVWGPQPSQSIYGSSYYLSITDAYSRYTWLYCLKKKSDVSTTFLQF